MCLQWLHNFKASPLMTRSGSFGKQGAEGASGESQASWVPKGQGETPGHRLFVETLRQKDREKLTACRICLSHLRVAFRFSLSFCCAHIACHARENSERASSSTAFSRVA